ncbi:hypothetical protein [Methylobacterium sp. sgz302541]|uniref:hypothetical protein n=1 Tax=unclassified Methylobacterium TaxID=2615210 RepID=UPI003D349CA8
MRRLVTGGIKAILAIAALSTAAHWAMRMNRAPSPLTTAIAAMPDPATTGSIDQRRVERPVPDAPKAEPVTRGLDQRHLSMLIAGAGAAAPAAAAKPAAKAAAKTPAKR